MANEEISNMPLNAPAAEDLLQIINDPSGTPTNQQTPLSAVLPWISITQAEIDAGLTDADINILYAPGNVLRYGTNTTPGTTDMTTAIQAALDSNGFVWLPDGDVYLVSQVGTKTINGTAHRYCLTLPDNTLFDLGVGTVKLADSQNAAIIINATAGTTQNTDLGVINGWLDGNQTNQTTPATGEMACIFLHDVVRPRFDSRVKNARQYFGRFLACTILDFGDLYGIDSYGDGWSFGVDPNSQRCIGGKIGNVYSEGCLGTFGSLQGNAAIFTTKNTICGDVTGKNCAGATKIQDSSENAIFGNILNIGNTNGTANSGLKIQGNNGAGLYPKGIVVGDVVSENCWGNGFQTSSIHSVQIGQYTGRNNGNGSGASGSDQYDIDIRTTNGSGPNYVQTGPLYSEDNGATIAVRISGDGEISTGVISLYNPVGIGVQNTASGFVDIEGIKHIDDAGTPTTTQVYKQTGAAEGRCGPIKTNLPHSTSLAWVELQLAADDFLIESIRLGNTDPLEGVVALAAATSTAVSNGHIWRTFVGGSSYLHPIIQIIPWDSASMALGSMRTVVTDGSSGTGFTIHHATATTADDVYWKVIGWKVVSKASG